MTANASPHGGCRTSVPVEVAPSHFSLIFERIYASCGRIILVPRIAQDAKCEYTFANREEGTIPNGKTSQTSMKCCQFARQWQGTYVAQTHYARHHQQGRMGRL